jgi:hypothetical protein
LRIRSLTFAAPNRRRSSPRVFSCPPGRYCKSERWSGRWAEQAFDAIFSGPGNQLSLFYLEEFLRETIGV